jgi:hypothetical protein
VVVGANGVVTEGGRIAAKFNRNGIQDPAGKKLIVVADDGTLWGPYVADGDSRLRFSSTDSIVGVNGDGYSASVGDDGVVSFADPSGNITKGGFVIQGVSSASRREALILTAWLSWTVDDHAGNSPTSSLRSHASRAK